MGVCVCSAATQILRNHNLLFDANTDFIYEKAKPKTVLLRKTIRTFAMICWFYNFSTKNKKLTFATCIRLELYSKHKVILRNSQHLWNSEFNLLPSGQRFYFPWGDTNRQVRYFIVSAIGSLNKMWFCSGWDWCSLELLLLLLILVTGRLALTYVLVFLYVRMHVVYVWYCMILHCFNCIFYFICILIIID